MSQQHSVITLTFFQYSGFKNKLWAFRAMGKSTPKVKLATGLQFVKLMGSGGKNGFGLWPNFGIYALLCTWSSENEAHEFHKNNTAFKDFMNKSDKNQTLWLSPISSHGTWDGANPFTINNEQPIENEPIAVITRGKIKWSKLWAFWQFVPPASQNIEAQVGLIYSIGIGELPLIQQATFSIWENTEKMKKYAYKSKQHTEVIRKTRELGWYSEELFARFKIVKSEGDIEALNL
jgi:hypothetical protein